MKPFTTQAKKRGSVVTTSNKLLHDIEPEDQERDPDRDVFVHRSTTEDNQSPVGKVWESVGAQDR